MDSREPDDYRKDLRRYSGLGVDLVANTLVGLGFGYLLDRWLGTTPWLMIVGLVMGSVSGFMTIFRALSEQDREDHRP
ncbi:MAG: AtpZ/AtpI family protein [Actinomycetota bacterium]|nr:AtpZ/AtpI family protein [Actinomycetota bacterium]